MNHLQVIGVVLLVLALLGGTPRESAAVVAANTRIVAPVSVSFWDGAATVTLNVSATVTVALVSAQPTLLGSDVVSVYGGADTPASVSFTLTSTSNGPESYRISATYNSPVNSLSPQAPVFLNSVVLGGSITVLGSTESQLALYADGNNDGAINGLAAGDRVMVDGEERTVTSISDLVSGTSLLFLDLPLSAVPTPGTLVQERRTLIVTAYSGTIQTPGTTIHIPVRLEVSSGAGATSAEVHAVFTPEMVVLEKFARNLTNGAAGASPILFAGETYYRSGITAAPGDVVEYLLRLSNYGASSFPDARIEDYAPIQMTFVAGGYPGGDLRYVASDTSISDLSLVADVDPATLLVGNHLVVNVGTGATAAAGGTVATGDQIHLLYQTQLLP